MADYVVDFLLGTGEMKQVLSDSKKGVSGGGGGSVGGGGGGMKVFGMLSILDILKELKSVMDTVSFLMATLSTGLVYLVGMFVQWITPFFKDPVRFLLEVFLDNANMIIGALEFMTNTILGALTFGAVGGFDENKIEFPRFQKDIILEAYDNMKSVILDSESGVSDIAKATLDFTMSFVDGFMTNSEYAKLMEDSASENFGKVIGSIGGIGGMADSIANAITKTERKIQGWLNKINDREVNVTGYTPQSNDSRSALEITRDIRETY